MPATRPPNEVTWQRDCRQFNQTTTRLSFINGGLDQRSCLHRTPTVDYVITTQFRGDCKSFVWTSEAVSDVSLLDSSCAHAARHGRRQP